MTPQDTPSATSGPLGTAPREQSAAGAGSVPAPRTAPSEAVRPSPPTGLAHELDPETSARIASAPLPTAGTLRRRMSVGLQAWRFVLINLRMISMIRKGHG